MILLTRYRTFRTAYIRYGSRGVAGRQEVDSQSRIVQPKGEGMMLEVDSESKGEAGRQEVDKMSRVISTMGEVATINKLQPQWMPVAFVRIGSVGPREIHLPVTLAIGGLKGLPELGLPPMK